MPLPASDIKAPWPPAQLNTVRPTFQRWDAWYKGDVDDLQAAYGGGFTGGDPASAAFYGSDTGRFKAAMNRTLHRWFVGEPARGNERNQKLIIPTAAEIAQGSADLLFADPFTVTVPDDATQKRVDEMLDEDFHTTIAEAAEMCAALGGVYLVVAWDPTLLDHPFPIVRNTDQAIPQFSFGRLTAVTFWNVVASDGKNVWRHLERHELGNAGIGIIRHGLYQGTQDTLGIAVPLTMQPATAGLAVHTDLQVPGTIDTRSPGLAALYVPNQTPNRRWRNDPVGSNLGRADIDGVEHLLDQLAETMSDLMRARRVARARIMHSKALAKTGGPGQGSILNTAQEDYVAVDSMRETKLSDQVQLLQPTFDPSGYLATASALLQQIVEMAGYSAQTFGLDEGGSTRSSGTRTATEVESRERRSLMTRDRKIREWKPALVRLITKILLVDAALFAGGGNPTGLDVAFSDGVQETQLSLAQTVLALYQSESASVEERLSILHPDWDETAIGKEAAKIRAEFAHAPLPNPEAPPFDPEDDDDDNGDGESA
jgi:A118 family predicted phage portal protein